MTLILVYMGLHEFYLPLTTIDRIPSSIETNRGYKICGPSQATPIFPV